MHASVSSSPTAVSSFMHASVSSSPSIHVGIAASAIASHCSVSTILDSSDEGQPSLATASVTSFNLSSKMSQASLGAGSSQQESQGTSSSGASQPGRKNPPGET